MSTIDKNIETVTKAAKHIETFLLNHDYEDAGDIAKYCKELSELIGTANFLQQIKAAQKPKINPPKCKIIKM